MTKQQSARIINRYNLPQKTIRHLQYLQIARKAKIITASQAQTYNQQCLNTNLERYIH